MMDMLSPEGYVHAVKLAMTTTENSMLAPVCSSWVWINSGTARRSSHNPLGDRTKSSVRSANRMVSRTILLLWIFMSTGTYFILEQPRGSCMQDPIEETHVRFCSPLRMFRPQSRCDRLSPDHVQRIPQGIGSLRGCPTEGSSAIPFFFEEI